MDITMAETNLAQAVEAAKDAASYDTNVKFLLADKQILARILKYSLKEFQDMALGEIMSSIGEQIEVGGMVLTAELEGRMETMCNLSENIEARGIEKGIEKERAEAIGRMIKAGATKTQISSYGYTNEEFEAAKKLYM